MELTIDRDVDGLCEDSHGWKRPAGDLALILRPIVLLARQDRHHAHRLPLPVRGGNKLCWQGLAIPLSHPGDGGGRAASQGGAGEGVLLPLHCLAGRLHHRRLLRRKQDRQSNCLCEELHPGSVLLDPALKPSVVPVVVCVRDLQVIPTLQSGLLNAASLHVISLHTSSGLLHLKLLSAVQRHCNWREICLTVYELWQRSAAILLLLSFPSDFHHIWRK